MRISGGCWALLGRPLDRTGGHSVIDADVTDYADSPARGFQAEAASGQRYGNSRVGQAASLRRSAYMASGT